MNDSVDTLGTITAGSSLKSLTGMAFDQIKADIILGRLRPEERLKIHSLARRYCVGTTAVREALSRLVADDWVVAEEQRGFCVAPISEADLLDLTQTRVKIEGIALSKAIEVGDVEWESGVLSAFHRLYRCCPSTDESCELPRQWGLVHRQFHESLLAGCMSPCLLRLTSLLFDKCERYRNIAEYREETSLRDVGSEHKALRDAALQRNAPLAVQLIADHIQATTDTLLMAGFVSIPKPPESERDLPRSHHNVEATTTA